MLDSVLDIVTRRRGRRIWDSHRTVKGFEENWYENLARIRVYELIGVVYKPGTTLLDSGCGVGFDAERILSKFDEVRYTGIDTSRTMIDRCKEKLGHFPNARFEEGDTFNLKFENRSFDVVISCNVLVHVPGFVAALRELCRACDHHLILQLNYINEDGDYLQNMSAKEFDKRFLDRKSNMYFIYYNPQEIVDICLGLGFRRWYKENFFLDKYNREATVLQFTRE